jgi:hypothetical protein
MPRHLGKERIPSAKKFPHDGQVVKATGKKQNAKNRKHGSIQAGRLTHGLRGAPAATDHKVHADNREPESRTNGCPGEIRSAYKERGRPSKRALYQPSGDQGGQRPRSIPINGKKSIQ